MRFLVSIAAVFAFAFAANNALATTYYVSPSGSDSNSGTSTSAAWRTVNHVNNAALAPGDTVLFQGGQTFSDSTLMPSQSGISAAPITFGSYGAGRATISNSNGAVWFVGKSYLTFQNLSLTTGGAASSIVSGSSGGGSSYITIANSVLQNTAGIGIIAPTQGDANWTISGNTISHIGDSGLIMLGSNHVVSSNTISDTGWNSAITYGKHGIYDKGPNTTVSNNDFSNNQGGQAISIRFHGARVYGNSIHDTGYAIAFFDYDTAPAPQGTSYIYSNKIWNISGWGFYYAGELDPNGRAPTVDFVVDSNTFHFSGASEAVNVSESGSAHVTIVNNVFTGSYGSALRTASTTVEHHNDWWGGSSNIPNGTGDLHVLPSISNAPDLSPASTSPIVDKGTSSNTVLSYTTNCDGQPLHYCGTAPEMGAAEYMTSTADTTAPTAPTALVASNQTATSLSLAWTPSTDNVGVTGYDVYKNGIKLGSTSSTSYVYSGLTCGTSYTLGVAAYDAAGNHSAVTNATASTSACATSDTTAPSAPSGLVASNQTTTSLSLAWTASTDNVGVTGYDVYQNGSKLGSTSSTSYAFSGLACGTTYTLGVAAYDAAGNHSAVTSTTASTASCSAPPPPPPAGPPVVTINDPINGSLVSYSFTVTASAQSSIGISKLVFYLDDLPLPVCTVNSGSGSCLLQITNSGWHLIKVVATDTNGATGSSTIQVKGSRK